MPWNVFVNVPTAQDSWSWLTILLKLWSMREENSKSNIYFWMQSSRNLRTPWFLKNFMKSWLFGPYSSSSQPVAVRTGTAVTIFTKCRKALVQWGIEVGSTVSGWLNLYGHWLQSWVLQLEVLSSFILFTWLCWFWHLTAMYCNAAIHVFILWYPVHKTYT